jgi:glycosyltransferase involved in cell wall biosynthesis
MKKWHVTTPTLLIENGTRCKSGLTTEIIYDSISVSRLVPWKNLDFFVQSAALGDFRIAICGEGPEKAKLEMLSKTLDAKVDFLGELDSVGVREALQSSKTFVNISSYEGLSFSLIEAMMEGKACIVSDIKGNTDVIEDGLNGLVVALGSTEELTGAIRECVNDPEYATQLGKEARKLAQSNYCEETQLRKMMMALTGLE